MSTPSHRAAPPGPSPAVRVIALLGGAVILAFGIWALVAPRSFFDAVATFEPYNRHLIHDVGAFQAGLGLVLLLAASPRPDAPAVALLGVGAGAGLHVVSHVLDRGLGGRPVTDIPSLTLLALALLAAGVVRYRRVSRGG